MPHLTCSAKEIDQLYPSFGAPNGEELHDLVDDKHDCVYMHGKKVAEGIQTQSETDGRRRRPREATEEPVQLLQHDYDYDHDCDHDQDHADYRGDHDYDHDYEDGGENSKGMQDP